MVPISQRAWRSAWWWLAVVAVSVAAVIALAVVDTAVASGAEDLRSLDFGAPLAWVVQESSLDPPVFPARVAFSDPHETVTRVLPPRLVADIAVVLALVVAAWIVLAAGMGRAGCEPAPVRRCGRRQTAPAARASADPGASAEDSSRNP